MAEANSSTTPKITDTDKAVVTKKSLVGLDGWLAFLIVAAGAAAVGFVWAFFVSISVMSSGLSGVGLGVAIETLIFSLGLAGLFGFTLFLIVNRRKLAKLWAYITLGVMALYVTVVSITTMFSSWTSETYSSYDCSGAVSFCDSGMQGISSTATAVLPASAIVMLFGLIFVTWDVAILIAYYFKKSQRVAMTLVK